MVKTITVTEEAYNKIKRLKAADESFSDLFKRLGNEKNPLPRMFGIISKDEAEKAEKEIREYRKAFIFLKSET
ncbi:antitoxin VapB family protein [Candidatus Woesearchaeota archaeon]|nr:antitoxin VapB family protein [Candidatus Woesearchaeota archaeon]